MKAIHLLPALLCGLAWAAERSSSGLSGEQMWHTADAPRPPSETLWQPSNLPELRTEDVPQLLDSETEPREFRLRKDEPLLWDGRILPIVAAYSVLVDAETMVAAFPRLLKTVEEKQSLNNIFAQITVRKLLVEAIPACLVTFYLADGMSLEWAEEINSSAFEGVPSEWHKKEALIILGKELLAKNNASLTMGKMMRQTPTIPYNPRAIPLR